MFFTKESTDKFEGFKFNGFKLISLKIKDIKLFGNIDYEFIDNSDAQDKLYTTVIVGPNGTRKSLLFNLLISIFKTINDLKENKAISDEINSKYPNGYYVLTYALNNHIYEFSRNAKSLAKEQRFFYGSKRNGKPIPTTDLALPISIVANSISLTDKFPMYGENEFKRYHYLGIKSSSQAASTKSYLKKIVDYVANLTFNEAFLNGLHIIAQNFIGDNKDICITYQTTEHSRFFNGELTLEMLDKYFENMEIKYKKTGKKPPFRLSNYKTLKNRKDDFAPSTIERILNYCNNFKNLENIERKKGHSNYTLKFNLTSYDHIQELKTSNRVINELYAIGLLNKINVEFEYENRDNYTLEDSSSGEHNLITSFIGLMATVNQSGLVLIDEPEISLHPNWQMRYVSFLKEIFSHEVYKNTHVIIASHSHFIVSDLEKDSSKIIGLTKDKGMISVIDLPLNINTYGWSAEDVLFRIFNVKSSRNHYFEMAVAELLDLLYNKSKNTKKIKSLIKELKELKISSNDPLNELIEEAEGYIENDKSNN